MRNLEINDLSVDQDNARAVAGGVNTDPVLKTMDGIEFEYKSLGGALLPGVDWLAPDSMTAPKLDGDEAFGDNALPKRKL